ncbi:MAG: PhzF family phenazine biosynthesis protein [Myxococcales bacterium]|nr:PhzF family phenazine biosynthesis protein [Myxococcales bacterium]MCB9717549.1 PhzF family phenazine biosynthesis protein [Myxococcales bacterium]
MKLPLYQVDAFTERPFAGNPAAVCPLPRWLDDALLQAIAAENNLSETAFLVPQGDDWELRWFTPAAEVDLCGHATLATAFVLLRQHPGRERLRFHTREAGLLTVERRGDELVMDLPARPTKPVPIPPGLVEALGGVEPVELRRAVKTMAVFEDEATVRALDPDLVYLVTMEGDGLIVTAPGDEVDFVSRYFAPHVGIDEDPVTGSAHCNLTPYWAERLGKASLRARQVSARGGELGCTLRGDRVELAGRAALYLEGTIELPDA